MRAGGFTNRVLQFLKYSQSTHATTLYIDFDLDCLYLDDFAGWATMRMLIVIAVAACAAAVCTGVSGERWSRQVSHSEWIPLTDPRTSQTQRVQVTAPSAPATAQGGSALPLTQPLPLSPVLQHQYQEQLQQLQRTQENIQKLLALQRQLKSQQQLLHVRNSCVFASAMSIIFEFWMNYIKFIDIKFSRRKITLPVALVMRRKSPFYATAAWTTDKLAQSWCHQHLPQMHYHQFSMLKISTTMLRRNSQAIRRKRRSSNKQNRNNKSFKRRCVNRKKKIMLTFMSTGRLITRRNQRNQRSAWIS